MDNETILIDGLEYVNWNRDLFEKAHAGGLTAIHATLVYWEDTVSYTHLTLPTKA